MKFIYKYSFLLLLLVTLSCKDALQEDPKTFFDVATIFSTEAGIESAVNGLYFAFSGPDYYGTAWHNVMMPHSGIFYSSQKANLDITSLNATSSNPNLNKLWAQQFATINSANTIIANLEDATTELENSSRALGQAYFIRGKVYLDLLRMFGGVPLKTEPTNIENIHQGRATKEEIIEQIISDLNIAKEMMPEAGATINQRPGKLAANIYLAKLYSFLGGSENGNTADWHKAYDELLPVIESGVYELTPTYAELFEQNNENTVESIFELQYANTGGIRNSDIIRLYTPANSIFSPASAVTFGRIRPNKEVFDQHVAQYEDDPRIDATFLYDSYPKNDGGTQKIYPEKKNGNQGFAVIAKWFDAQYNGTSTERNYIILRYADVLLMMAEIENELNGPEGAYVYVNQVLTRARDMDGDGASDTVEPADWSGMDKETFRARIMKERLYELLSEGQSWFDTRRRGYQYLLENVIKPHNSNPTFDDTKEFMYPDSEKNLLLPIPLSELSGNQMVGPEDQNPGY